MTPDDERNMTLASQGDARAQYNVAFMYYIGKGVPRDKEKAKEWLKKSAEQGYAEAQDQLSALFNIEIVGTQARAVRKSSTRDDTGGKEPEKSNARLISCPVCERMVSPQAETCPNCGQPISSAPKSAKKEDAGKSRNSKNCPACGEKISSEATQCQYCRYTYKTPGTRRTNSEPSSSSETKQTVAEPQNSEPTNRSDKVLGCIFTLLVIALIPLLFLGIKDMFTAPDRAPKEILEPAAMYAIGKLVGPSGTDKHSKPAIDDIKDVQNYTLVLDGEKWKCTEMTANLYGGGTHKANDAWDKVFPRGYLQFSRSVPVRIKIAYINRGNQYEYRGIDVRVIKK